MCNNDAITGVIIGYVLGSSNGRAVSYKSLAAIIASLSLHAAVAIMGE